MAEALLTGEPQTPTDGTTAAQASPTGMVDVGAKQPSAAPSAQPTTETKAPAAPEKYEFKLDNGVKLADGMQTAVETSFREAGLTNEAANKLLNSLVKSHQESQTAAVDALRSKWAEETKTDKVLGGEKLTETLKFAKQALKEFGSSELTELLDATGLSDNKHFIGLLAQIGRKIGGDQIVTGAPPKGSEDDLAARLYPSMAKKG